jgi:hypothetical protein
VYRSGRLEWELGGMRFSRQNVKFFVLLRCNLRSCPQILAG